MFLGVTRPVRNRGGVSVETLLTISVVCLGIYGLTQVGSSFHNAIAGEAPGRQQVGTAGAVAPLATSVLAASLPVEALRAATDLAEAAPRAPLHWDTPPPAWLRTVAARSNAPLAQGNFHEIFAVRGNARLAVKVRRWDRMDTAGDILASEWYHATDLHKRLGGPRVDGIVRVNFPDGTARMGIAMERLHGKTLKTWLEDSTEVSRTQIERLRGSAAQLLQRAAALDVGVDDFHLLNLMLTDDGRVVPFDMQIRPHPTSRDRQTTEFFGAVLGALRDVEEGLPPLAYSETLSGYFTPAYAHRLRTTAIRLRD